MTRSVYVNYVSDPRPNLSQSPIQEFDLQRVLYWRLGSSVSICEARPFSYSEQADPLDAPLRVAIVRFSLQEAKKLYRSEQFCPFLLARAYWTLLL